MSEARCRDAQPHRYSPSKYGGAFCVRCDHRPRHFCVVEGVITVCAHNGNRSVT